jgi:hypothetical protein
MLRRNYEQRTITRGSFSASEGRFRSLHACESSVGPLNESYVAEHEKELETFSHFFLKSEDR